MWIEQLEFIGFGNLTGQRIEFGKNKLSIVVQPNEYGKSTIAEAIWATLFDYPDWDPSKNAGRPGVERKPLSGAAFKAVLDLLTEEKHMRLIRNFSERSLKVLDLSKDLGKANADITAEFAEAIANQQFGPQLTGLSRNLFRSCCFVGQRELDRTPFAGDRSLSSLLLSIADTGGTSFNVFEAIARLEEKMAHFPFRGKTYVAAELVETLESQRASLAEILKRLENDRQNCDRDVERLAEVEEQLQHRLQALAADEYFQLCLESADLDSRLSRAQEKSVRITELQDLVKAFSKFEFFPIDRQKDVEELWIGRQARLSDLRRMEGEVQTKSVESQIRNLEHRERSDGLEQFTLEDSQVLSSLARTLKDVSGDLQETKARRDEEYGRVQALGIDLNQLRDVRKSLLSLEPKEVDDVHAYHAMLVGARDKADECMRSVEKAHNVLTEIGKQREMFLGVSRKLFWLSLVVAVGSVGAFLYLNYVQHMAATESPASLVCMLWGLSCVVAAGSYLGTKSFQSKYRISDENLARNDEYKQTNTAQELVGKVANLEARIEELARKAGLPTGKQLLDSMQDYSKWSTQLRELDLLEHNIQSKESHVNKLQQQVADFFRKANRPVEEINPREASKLAESVNRFLDDRRRVESSSGVLDHRQSEVRFLGDEVQHSEALLCDQFQRAGLTFTDVQDGYYQWTEAIVAYRRWETNRNELIRLEQDPTTDLVPSELPRIIEKLETKRSNLWMRMQQLVVSNPDIATIPPPVGDSMREAHGQEMAELRGVVEELRRERDELTVQLRASMKNYQDNYLKTLEELEAVEHDLNHVKSQRTSLLLARDTFLRLADENHSVWADKLTDITREMLKHLGTEYETIEFDADLSISVRRKGQRESLNEWHMNGQLSTGTREQLHWLARMAVVRFLSNNKALPIILDEPFSEFDDERFLKIMRFLINNIARRNQVIIFSCHQQRHEWLMDQLDPRERENVELCRLVSLKTASVR